MILRLIWHLEIDLTSRTHKHIYAALGVAELWRFENGNLLIYILQDGQYVESENSLNFPNLQIKEVIFDCLQQVNLVGRNQVMKILALLVNVWSFYLEFT